LKTNPGIVILYSELAEYSLACFRALAQRGAKILLVHWPINPEAPFVFDLDFCERAVSRSEVNNDELKALVQDFNPDLIMCSGWMDRGYVATCKLWRQSIPTVLTLDNHWKGTWRQRLAVLVAPFTLAHSFSRAFVPGSPQLEYARKLGFARKDIQTGFYSADLSKFNKYYDQLIPDKEKSFPKRFLFVGRYVQHKGIYDVWEAFQQVQKEYPDWELWCCGTGEEFENRVESPGIRHFGFVQPSEFLPILKDTGVYILGSHFEPWGVSVHEMAASGYPMILSDEVGAREAFLRDGMNGYLYEPGNVGQLVQRMKTIAQKTPEELLAMTMESHQLAQEISPDVWAQKTLSFL